MEYEDVLKEVGGYGRFQKFLVYGFLTPVYMVISWYSMNLIFMVSVPEHWCHVSEIANSDFNESTKRYLIGPEDEMCAMYDVNYTQLLFSNVSAIPKETKTVSCLKGWTYDDSNYVATAATKWDMVCDRSYLPSLILTLQNVGSLIITPVVSFFSDMYGRKTVFFALCLMVAVTEVTSVLVPSLIVFAILRTINGSSMPTMYVLPYILVTELVEPESRGYVNAIINFFWTIGFCVLPLIAYLSKTWINLGLFSSMSAVFLLMYWRFIPESPCWLLSQGEYEKAAAIMFKIGQKNKRSLSRSYILSKLQALGEDLQKKKDEEKKDSSSRFFKYPTLRKHCIILTTCWVAYQVAYNGPMYNVGNMAGNEFVNFFLLSAVEIPGNVVFWLLMDRVGRRWTAAISYMLIGVACLLPVTGLSYTNLICAMIIKFIISGNFMVTDQQSSELFPTVVRSTLIGTCKTVALSATLMVPYLTYLNSYGREIPFLVIGATCFLAGIMSAFLPETLNQNLPQALSDAEELGRNERFWSWIGHASASPDTTSIRDHQPENCLPDENFGLNTHKWQKTTIEDTISKDNSSAELEVK